MSEKLSIEITWKAIGLIFGLVILLALLISFFSGRRATQAEELFEAIKIGCRTGDYSVEFKLPERSKSIVEIIKGRDPAKYIRLRRDPWKLIYYEHIDPIVAYTWSVYYSDKIPEVYDFGESSYYIKGTKIDDFKELLSKKAADLGYGKQISINIYSNGTDYLIFRNVIANNSILSYKKDYIEINQSGKLSDYWKYFTCYPRSICYKEGNKIYYMQMKGCLDIPYVGGAGKSVYGALVITSPCTGRIRIHRDKCKCDEADIPVFIYDSEHDSGEVVDIEPTCLPRWLSQNEKGAECMKIEFKKKDGVCFPDMEESLNEQCYGYAFGYDNGKEWYASCPALVEPDETSLCAMKPADPDDPAGLPTMCGALNDIRWKG